LQPMSAIMRSPRSALTMENRHGTCGYQPQRAFHLPLRRSRFSDQKCHRMRSCVITAFTWSMQTLR
jgi:hypothetical protein